VGSLVSPVSFALAALLAAVLAPALQGRGQRPFTVSVNVDLVVLNVSVTDSRGRHVDGLTARDFEIREDGSVQRVAHVSIGDVPATVGLVIDSSGSMREKRSDVASAVLVFARSSHAEDEMFLVTFNERVSLGLPSSMPFTSDPDQIRSALARTVPTGLTALYDALAVGLAHVNTGARTRKALVLLSDGGDNASRRRLEDVLADAQRSSATIFTIGVYDDTDLDRNPRVLRTIARRSGGQAYFPRSAEDLGEVWRDIGNRIRNQYTLSYHSSNTTRDGMFRAIKVTVAPTAGRDLRVTTRDGYRAAPAPGAP
jgi:Ca-activated chloride channel homolog